MKTTKFEIADARELMESWVCSPALRVHMECVAACCGAYAELRAPDEVAMYLVTGLLHDFDYEKHPTVEEHPFVGVKYLRELGLDEQICLAILGHAEYSGTPRESLLAKVLFAVDELAGFIVACAKVRPNGISDLKPKSVTKKLKDKAFAAAVNREEIANGIAELEVDQTAHIQLCIAAIRKHGERMNWDL